jgi:RNA polymerase sigma factor (sigma-70 family)
MVCNPSYIPQGYEASFVAENSPLKNLDNPGQLEWEDDEIIAIRTALRKSTLLRIWNSDDVEDLVQDTLLTIVTKPPGSELEKGLLVWSLGVLRNKVGNYYRKPNRHIPLNEIETGLPQWMQQSFSFSPEANASDKELRAIIDEKVAEMPPCQREVMELLVSGLDSREIVSQMHRERRQNVINRIHRGRKKLAKELARYGYGPGPMTGLKRARGKR